MLSTDFSIKDKEKFSVQSYHSKSTGLHIGFEPLTVETQKWWREYLANNVAMIFWKPIKDERRSISSAPYRYGKYDCLETYNYGEADLMLKRLGHFDESFIDQEGQDDLTFASSEYGRARDFLCAFAGFEYNLGIMDGCTYIVYISTKPIGSKRACELFQPATSDIIMAMTVRCKDFSGPLGIFRSPIHVAHNKKVKGVSYGNISPLLHSATARFVLNIHTKINVAIVRPLQEMGQILKSMKVPFVSTSGFGTP